MTLAAGPTALIGIHTAMVPIVLAAGGLTLLCGLVLYFMSHSDTTVPVGLRRTFHLLLVITMGIGLVQTIVGGFLLLSGGRPGNQLHFVYGGIVLLAIPVAYVYSDQKQVRRDILIMSIAALAIFGATLRAWATGPHPGH
ncbi:MAG: hypothetical protein IVW57_06505 [Ktedonobacterales bacterium]|nr:hypothetical protein [Ktedonobacterales bacterium]